MRSEVPPGTYGECEVREFVLYPKDCAALNRWLMDSGYLMRHTPGVFKELWLNGKWVMSDSNVEATFMRPFQQQATGAVLLTGLGLGAILRGLLEKEDVTKVTVVEHHPDILALANFYQHPKLRPVLADAFSYTPDTPHDCAFHDLWVNLDAQAKQDQERLRTHYAPFVGWQMCRPPMQ